ncbi:MAG: hypothetical protein ACRD12_00550 [Acidimicrobiales bacterium]
MIRAAYLIGRILAALGGLFVVAVVTFTMVSLTNADNCHEPDCDDVAFERAINRAAVLLPVSVVIGAAGVALINDTYRKVEEI